MIVSYKITEVLPESFTNIEYKNTSPSTTHIRPTLSRVENITAVNEFPDFPEPEPKPVDINKATVEELASLYVSQSILQKVIKERLKKPFENLENLDKRVPLPYKKKWSTLPVVFESDIIKDEAIDKEVSAV